MGEGPIVLGLSDEGAKNVLAFLEADRDGQAKTEVQIAARDCMIYLLEGRLYNDRALFEVSP
jgi:hypothetical protein